MRILNLIVMLLWSFLVCSIVSFGQGTSCSSAIVLLPDGVCRQFNASGATGAVLGCNWNGNQSNVTWFSITTNSSATCPRIEITTTPAIAFELVVYDGCNGSASQYMYPHTICSLDGDALWSPDSYNPLQPNKTYYFRVRTSGTFPGGVFNICTSWNTQTNDDCPTALPIGPSYVWDDNACNTPGPGITAQSICAFTLENTAWYKFKTLLAGNSVITIKSIDCDNFTAGSSDAGFQIGFFTGSCNALQQMPPCTTGAADGNGLVQFTSPPFPAGTDVWVAIDGVSGSNCKYEIEASNSVPLDFNPNPPLPRPPSVPLYTINPRNNREVTTRGPVRMVVFDMLGRLIGSRVISGTYYLPYASGVYQITFNGKTERVWLR